MVSNKTDTTVKKKSIVDSPVHYSAKDSMTMVYGDKMVYLYGKGNIKYEDFDLTSEYIESDLDKKEVSAKGVKDTLGKYSGKPLFKQGNEEFESDSLIYNLGTGKGLISKVVTKQGDGYLHSDLTKRDNEGHIHVKGGKYTTCNAEHPHFYLELSKAIVIPDDKIISGPAYMVIEDIPIPILGLPFSFFPNSKQRGAGILLPRYGEEQNRGFYLRDFGWYQPLGQHMDMQVMGEVYSKGSYGIHWGSNYKWRYKFGGSMRIDFNENIANGLDRSDKDDPNYKIQKDFRWTWSHRQDPKANPTQSFSANVNFSSSGFDRNNATTTPDHLTNQKSSSISYTKSWPGTPFNLSLSATARQNTTTESIDLDVPTGSFNASTIYPFRKKNPTGQSTWYQEFLDDVGFSYSSSFSGKAHGINDTMLFYRETWENMDKSFSHRIPFFINIKSKRLKMVTISPSLSYSGELFDYYMVKRVEVGDIDDDPVIVTDTIQKYTYAHAINPSIGIGLTPKITGMYQNTRPNPNLIAVRHVIQPKASFSYTPNMRNINPNYYDTLYYMQDGEVEKHSYSFVNSPPSSPGRNASLSLGLSNTLDAKIKPKDDTTGMAEPEKVSLIRNFNISTAYYPFKEEFKWNDVSLNASTQLFKNKLNLQISNAYSLYDFSIDTVNGNRVIKKIDEFYYENGKGFLRFTRLSLSASLSLRSQAGDDDKNKENTDNQYNTYQDPLNPEFEFVPGYSAATGTYVDFSVPWSLSFRYNWSLNRPYLVEDQTITHTLNVNGDFSLTEKWKIGFNSGYDIESKKITFTNLNIHRDLHCWEMQFSIVPFGERRNYNFYIRAKSALLRDLKLDKKQHWRDTL